MKVAMVSSTVRDLPEHRTAVMDACLRQGVMPKMMEHLSAADADAIRISRALVEESDLYIGVLGVRYGEIPEGHEKSITEMEYDWALERQIPRLMFVIDAKKHAVPPDQVEMGAGAERLELFKERVRRERVVGYFDSPATLRALVIQSLSTLRTSDRAVVHFVHSAPSPPEAYVAHPYTLLQTKEVVGRREELNMLTDWVARPDAPVHAARVLSLVAVGGMGKSALTWKWFSDVAAREMRPLAGRMWWSFYESDATYENFIDRALSYVTGQAPDELARLPVTEQETRLLRVLDEQPFLVVLDGLERILMAYARIDAAQLVDGELDHKAAASPDRARTAAVDLGVALPTQHRLRQTIDPRAGSFLRRLVHVRSSRILISTRLVPTELQTTTGADTPGARSHVLGGLKPDDAVELWRAFEVTGSRDQLLRLFATFDYYPLLIRALAGEVARYRRAPGDFDRWHADHPAFDPYGLELIQARSHVLEFALRGVTEAHQQVLHIVAAFRAPTTYDTLAALLVGPERTFGGEAELDAALTELEDRGLVGWDRRANRYDEHPIVRGVSWRTLEPGAQRDIYESFRRHFAAIPEREVRTLDDLSPALELFHALVKLERWEEAWWVVEDRIEDHVFDLGDWETVREVLEALFDPRSGIPRVVDDDAAEVYLLLAVGLELTGRPSHAIRLCRRALGLADRDRDRSMALATMAAFLCEVGELAEADAAAERALVLADTDKLDRKLALAATGVVRSVLGSYGEAAALLSKADALIDDDMIRLLLFAQAHRARNALWAGDNAALADATERAAEQVKGERGSTLKSEAAALQGLAALLRGDHEAANHHLRAAITRSREARLVGVEIRALLYAAELEAARSRPEAARRRVREAQGLAERGPYRLLKADSENLLARLARDTGDAEAAVEHSTTAYRLAWCDGPPHAYAHGLATAAATLEELEAAPPKGLEVVATRAGEAVEGNIITRERQSLVERLNDQDPRIRRDAARILATLKGVDAGALFQRALADGDASVRGAVVEGLRGRDEPAARKAIAKALADSEANVRAAAQTAAAMLLEPTPWKPLPDPELNVEAVARGLDDPDLGVRRAAARAFLWIVARQHQAVHPIDQRALLEAEDGPDPATLIRRLHESKFDPQLVDQEQPTAAEGGEPREPLAARLDDDDPAVRWTATAAIAFARRSGAGELVRPKLGDSDATVRAVAAAAQGVIAPDDPSLLPLLNDDDALVRGAAVRSIAKYARLEAIDPTIACLRDRDPSVRAAAADALGMITPPSRAVAELLAAAGDSEASVRASAVRALQSVADDEALDVLTARLEDDDVAVRMAAVDAIGYSQRSAALGPLRKSLRDSARQIRVAALGHLSRGVEDRYDQRLLRTKFEDNNPSIDPEVPVDAARVTAAAMALGVSETEAKQRYERLSADLALRLTWKPNSEPISGDGR
jgi:HEAT repeat protein